jgi:hypothetical protein
MATKDEQKEPVIVYATKISHQDGTQQYWVKGVDAAPPQPDDVPDDTLRDPDYIRSEGDAEKYIIAERQRLVRLEWLPEDYFDVEP